MFPFFVSKTSNTFFKHMRTFYLLGLPEDFCTAISLLKEIKRILIIVFATKQIKYIFLNFIFLNLFKYFSKCYIVLCHFHSLSVDGEMLS